MKKILENIKDFFWVLNVYLRGKVFHQEKYCPQNEKQSYSFFQLPVPFTSKRIIMLMRWWGLKPMTVKELVNFINDTSNFRVQKDKNTGSLQLSYFNGPDVWETNNDPFFSRKFLAPRRCLKI